LKRKTYKVWGNDDTASVRDRVPGDVRDFFGREDVAIKLALLEKTFHGDR
jgi:hypothetical protein